MRLAAKTPVAATGGKKKTVGDCRILPHSGAHFSAPRRFGKRRTFPRSLLARSDTELTTVHSALASLVCRCLPRSHNRTQHTLSTSTLAHSFIPSSYRQWCFARIESPLPLLLCFTAAMSKKLSGSDSSTDAALRKAKGSAASSAAAAAASAASAAAASEPAEAASAMGGKKKRGKEKKARGEEDDEDSSSEEEGVKPDRCVRNTRTQRCGACC